MCYAKYGVVWLTGSVKPGDMYGPVYGLSKRPKSSAVGPGGSPLFFSCGAMDSVVVRVISNGLAQDPTQASVKPPIKFYPQHR